ncbi:TIGR01440 family protein [Oceanobacillus sp. CAU 1775]
MASENKIAMDIKAVVDEWLATDFLQKDQPFVIGCSTSEVIGESIGTAGTEATAEILFTELSRLQAASDIQLAFQCCEHLNRAVVMERATMEMHGLTEVNVIPVPEAGGSMASFAYKNMQDPVVVETLENKAHAGIDIGETMIGMHFKAVVVPLRFSQKFIGEARLTAARTRPKLIGGSRAVYK